METTLCKLAYKYKSDKCKRLGKHTYTEYYDGLFNKKKASIKKVLEIGIGGRDGASLKMWRDFFPNAQIYGADYMPSRMINDTKIESLLVDQRVRAHLEMAISKTGTDVDIVIDDGSHRSRDQISTCLTLMPLLKKSVIYVIEDVADLAIVDRFNEYDVEVPALDQSLGRYGISMTRYDNRLVVVRHKKPSKTKNLSFFAKDPTRVGSDKHLARVSSIIRAHQIASEIGAKLNPTDNYQNDRCIYVKPPVSESNNFNFEGKKAYLDVVDEIGYKKLLEKHPNVGVISLSDWNFKVLKRILPNKVVNIPQQHCNFERYKRDCKNITTVGMIGTQKAFQFLPKGFREELKKRNLKFIEFSKFSTREDIVNFYMNIDIQVVWRPYYNYNKDILVNPLKIVNASSFGVPTIALSEPAFEEMGGCYIPVNNLEEFLYELDKLRENHKLYQKIETKCLSVSEKYHIEKIAKLYLKLA